MSQIMRTYLGFAAIGAGLIHLAMVVSSPLPVAIVLVGLGVTEFGWGILTFAKDRLIGASAARIAAVSPVIVWGILVVAATLFDKAWLASFLPLIPLAIATIFELFAVAVLSLHLRSSRGTDAATPAPALPSAGRYLLALTVGGIVVGALITPALAATEAGKHAQPHGEHNVDFVPAQVDNNPLSDLVLPDHEQH
jgi:xanthosine utilization system XapX-like protein